jgi:penicillin-binding protein 1C
VDRIQSPLRIYRGISRKYTVGVWTGNFSGEPMWNVSGITGAAPIWMEMMDFLHRDLSSVKREVPSCLIRKKIEFPQGIASSREEWFIRGTEPNSMDQSTGQHNQRILYPPSGIVIALDPDIPTELQKVFFISQTNEKGVQWKLNGSPLAMVGKAISWTPRAGKYLLAIVDQEDRIIDFIHFEVRGGE